MGSSYEEKLIINEGISIVLRLLAPIAPHITHQLWLDLDFGSDIQFSDWPEVDESALIQKSQKFILQVNGKVRSQINMPIDATKEEIEKNAISDENVCRFTKNKVIKKIVIVPGKLVNIVAD
tara:strand:- start:485 stop:850 length:366 start_codon:yes stop_codon:yes gene_type:complete